MKLKLAETDFPCKVFASLGWLYLVQGIPYGLQDKFIPLELKAHGLQYSSVGCVKAVLVPWVTKGLWAPLLQLYGNARVWLVTALLVLAASSFVGSLCDLSRDVWQVAGVLLLLNAACAVQDVVVDGLALQLLDESQLGAINSLQVVLYKVGSLCGGGGLLLLLSVSSWRSCLMLVSAVYLITAVWATTLSMGQKAAADKLGETVPADTLCERECERLVGAKYSTACMTSTQESGRSGVMKQRGEGSSRLQDHLLAEKELLDERSSKGEGTDSTSNASKIHSRMRQNYCSTNDSVYSEIPNFKSSTLYDIYRDTLGAPGTLWLALYVLLYKMGERGAINNFPLFLLDEGVSMSQLAFWNGTVCQTLSILGSIYGGYVLSSKSANITTLLIHHSIQRSLSILLQCMCLHWCQVYHLSSTPLLYLCSLCSLCWLSYSTGVISTLTFTLMMRHSRLLPQHLQASHYSCLASLEVAGKLAFATVAGVLVDGLGLTAAFVSFSALSAVPVILLLLQEQPTLTDAYKKQK